MWSVGKGPLDARLVRFKATATGKNRIKIIYVKSSTSGQRLLTSCDDGIVGSVDVDRLVEREEGLARNNRAVHGGVEIRDACPSEARDELRDVTDTLCGYSGVPRPVAVPKSKVCAVRVQFWRAGSDNGMIERTQGILKGFPIVLGEQLTEDGKAKRDRLF